MTLVGEGEHIYEWVEDWAGVPDSDNARTRSLNLVCMTDLPDTWDLPEPHGYHEHDGEEVPFYNIISSIQEPGKEWRK